MIGVHPPKQNFDRPVECPPFVNAVVRGCVRHCGSQHVFDDGGETG